jgi:phosphohistidine phosphatase
MDLFLVQHGEAKSETEDPERSLTDRGAESVRRMAAWAAQVGLGVDQIRHSGKKRAEQTAALLAERLSPLQGTIAVEGLNPNDDVRPVAEALQSGSGSVMMVGHLPFLDRLASLLLTGDPEAEVVRFRNAGIVALSKLEGKWAVNWAVPPDLVGQDVATGQE